MSGRSGTPLADRLALTAGMRVGLDDPPPEFVGLTLGQVPTGIRLFTRISGNMDAVLGFYRQLDEFQRRLPVLHRRIGPDGFIWIAWPTPASGVPTDMDADAVRRVARDAGLVATTGCVIDEMWSGLKLVAGDGTPDPADG